MENCSISYKSKNNINSTNLIPLFIFYSVCFLPFIILFINHLLKVKGSELLISKDKITFNKNGTEESLNFNEIIEVVQYSTSRYPWSSIIKWEIITATNKYLVSSLSISKLNFERFFYNKIKEKTDYFPTI